MPPKLTPEQSARLKKRDQLMTERRQRQTRDRLMSERDVTVQMPAESGRRPAPARGATLGLSDAVMKPSHPASPSRHPGGQRARRSGSSLGRRGTR